MSESYFSKINELLKKEQPFATATVVRIEKPTSAKPGDKAIITKDGEIFGWIGGSCAQPLVIEESIKALSVGKSRFIRLSTEPNNNSPREGLIDLPMTCFSGGTLEIYIEPQLPGPRLLVVGNLPIAHSLMQLAKIMNYRVIMVDPDSSGAYAEFADEVITDISEIRNWITPLTYIVVASHGNYDELALEQVLGSNAAYISLVASSSRAESVLEYLSGAGLDKDDIARLKYPAGLDLQAVKGDEIALSIMAEIVQTRQNVSNIDIEKLEGFIEVEGRTAESIDPVCGMKVNDSEAEFRFKYNETTHYFCSAVCKDHFSESPETYLESSTPAGEALDPVCNMMVKISTANYMSEYKHEFHYFCSTGCKMTFDKDPEVYLEKIKNDNLNV